MDRKICVGITTLHKQCTKYVVFERNYCSIHSEETDIRNKTLPQLCVGFRGGGIKCAKKAVHGGKYCSLHSEETDKVNSRPPKALQQCEGLTKTGKRCSRQVCAKFCIQHNPCFGRMKQDPSDTKEKPSKKAPPKKAPGNDWGSHDWGAHSSANFFEEFTRRTFEQYTPPPPKPQVDYITSAFDYFKSTRNDPFEVITKKYKKLALEYHPDKPTGSHDNFVELVKHYDIIKKYYKQ